MTPPRFSVICPTYDRGAAIGRTVASVQAQDVQDWELLVISDGSTDDTDTVVADLAGRDPRIRLLRLPHGGHPGAARNHGLRNARGDRVAYLDHDDEFRPEHLRELDGLLDRRPWAATAAAYVDRQGRDAGVLGPLDLCWSPALQRMGPLLEPSRTGHRRGLAEQVGGWTSQRRGLEDWDLWVRFTDAGHVPALSDKRTVQLLKDAGTRREQVLTDFVFVLVEASSAAHAAAVLEALQRPRALAAWRRALREDAAELLHREALHGGMVTASPLPADVADLVRSSSSDVRPDALLATYHAGMHVVGVPLLCVTPEHAAAATHLLRNATTRQRAVLADIHANLDLLETSA